MYFWLPFLPHVLAYRFPPNDLKYCKYPFDPFHDESTTMHPNPVWTGPTQFQDPSYPPPYIRPWLAEYGRPTGPDGSPSTIAAETSSVSTGTGGSTTTASGGSTTTASGGPVSGESPFLTSYGGLPSGKHNVFRLDCDSGWAWSACTPEMRPACDGYCQSQCFRKCNFDGTQTRLMDCLIHNGLSHCTYNYELSVVSSARACRRRFALRSEVSSNYVGNSTGDFTVYIIEPQYNELYNVKRIRRASVTLPLITDFTVAGKRDAKCEPLQNEMDGNLIDGDCHRDSERVDKAAFESDFGNLIRSTEGFSLDTCSANGNTLPWTLADEQLRRNLHGTVYKREILPSSVLIHQDVRELVTASALQALGGFPKQFLVWWPGNQPQLSQQIQPWFTASIQQPKTHLFFGMGLTQINDGVLAGW